MRRLVVIVAAVVLVSAIGVAIQPRWSLVAQTDAGVIGCWRVVPGDRFTISFTHSMYGGFVRETWEIDADGTVHRADFVTENAASAEYYAVDGRVERTSDGFRVVADPVSQNELIFRVNQRGSHWLYLDDRRVHLADLVQPSAQMRIGVESRSCR